jgi:hypothetical protein
MAATTHKRKSACAPAKSKKSKAAEAKGANNGVAEAKVEANVEADAEARASKGGGVITPSSPANNAGPPPVSAVGGDIGTALTITTSATKWGGDDEDKVADLPHRAVTNKDAPIPARGVVDNDAVVVIDKAPYPDN